MYAEFSETLEEVMANNPNAISMIQASLSDNKPRNVPFETASGKLILCLQRHLKVNEPGDEGKGYIYSCGTTLTEQLIRNELLVSRVHTTIDGCETSLRKAFTLIAWRCREHRRLLRRAERRLRRFALEPSNGRVVRDIERSLRNGGSRTFPFSDWPDEPPLFTLKLSPGLHDLPKSSCRCTLTFSVLPNEDHIQDSATIKSELEAPAPTVRRAILRIAGMCKRQSTNL